MVDAARAEENLFDASRAEESAARACLKRAGNLAGNATGTSNKRKQDEEEENAAGNCKNPARNPVRGLHGCGNESVPTFDPCTLGIARGVAERLTKQATTFTAGGNAPRSGATA